MIKTKWTRPDRIRRRIKKRDHDYSSAILVGLLATILIWSLILSGTVWYEVVKYLDRIK